MKAKVKRRSTLMVVFVMAMVYLVFGLSTSLVQASESSRKSANTYLNVICKYLYLGEKNKNTFDFNIKEDDALEGATYDWYIIADKGMPEAVSINSVTGVVTAKKSGTAYIRCKITLPDKTMIIPEAKVVVWNNITEVKISNIPENQTINAWLSTDFNRKILNTEAGKGSKASGITRWEIANDSAGVGDASENGIVTPTKTGKFSIRAVCFKSKVDYILWSGNKEAYSGRITAASNWVTINVDSPLGTATTRNQLNELLASENITMILLASEETMEVTIPEGNYSNKFLVVTAPKVSVKNYAYFKSIILGPANGSTWEENVIGNDLIVIDNKINLNIAKDAQVEDVFIGQSGTDSAAVDSIQSMSITHNNVMLEISTLFSDSVDQQSGSTSTVMEGSTAVASGRTITLSSGNSAISAPPSNTGTGITIVPPSGSPLSVNLSDENLVRYLSSLNGNTSGSGSLSGGGRSQDWANAGAPPADMERGSGSADSSGLSVIINSMTRASVTMYTPASLTLSGEGTFALTMREEASLGALRPVGRLQIRNITGRSIPISDLGGNSQLDPGSTYTTAGSGDNSANHTIVTAPSISDYSVYVSTAVASNEVTATPVNEGTKLSQSTLNGSFIDTVTKESVHGTLKWDNSDILVVKSGEFPWTFTPSEPRPFYTVKGTAYVSVHENNIRITVVTGSAITATDIDLLAYGASSSPLSSSVLSGSFKDPLTNQDVPGILAWDAPDTMMTGSDYQPWTFTPNNTKKYNVVKGSYKVQVIHYSFYKITAVTGSAITATVDAGKPLSTSSVNAYFISPFNGAQVSGTFVWDTPEILLFDSSEFAWTFTPANTQSYNVVKGITYVNVSIGTVITDINILSLRIKYDTLQEGDFSLNVSDESAALVNVNTAEKENAVRTIFYDFPDLTLESLNWNASALRYEAIITLNNSGLKTKVSLLVSFW